MFATLFPNFAKKMITDAGSDYYQLCYDDDDVSLPDENKIIQEVNKKKEFLCEHYTSSPRLIRSKFKIEADNDFLTSCSEVLEEANSILYKSSEGYQPPSERYSSDLFRTADGSMDSTALEESALPTPENSVTTDFVLEYEDDIDVNNVYVYDDIEFQHNQRESPDRLLAKPNMDRRYTSSSGISAGSPTGSSASSLSMEIEKLQHIHSSGSIVSSTETLKRAKSYDSNQLWAKSSFSRSSTPTGRKSPLLDFFLGKSKVYEFDDDFNVTKKKKQPKHKKSFDSVRSSSPFMFNLRKCSSLTSKDKFKNRKYSKSLPEVKKDLTNGVTDDSNTKTRLQQPSPFVKTIFQYVESSFDDELYGISGFNTKNDSTTPVFSCSNGKVLPEFKSNSLPRKNRNKNYLLSPIVKTITQNSQEPFLLSSGRRVSENSDFFISVVAYLDRIRKAQQKPTIASKRRPRQKRYRSDPGSVAKFLKDIEIPDEDKTMERHLFHETAPYQQNAVNKNNMSISLHKRFANLNDNPLLTSSSTGVVPSYSDPMINSISRSSTPTPKPNKNNSQLSRRTRSLKSIFTPFKKRNKETDKLKQRDSISLQLQSLCNLENDLSNRQSQCNSRDSRSDLQNFIREFEQHENESQLFPISRTDCDLDLETLIRQNHIKTEDICKNVDKNKIPYAYDNFTDLPSNLSDQMLAIELLRKLERLEEKQSCDVNIDKYEKRFSTSPETSVCLKDNTCEEGGYDKHNSEGVDLSSHFDYSSQLGEDIIAGTEKDAWRENSSIIRRNSNSHENGPHQNMTLGEQLESPSIMEEVVDKPNKVSKRLKGKSKKKYGRSNSDDIEYWTGSFKNSPPRNRQGKNDKDTTENIKGKSVFNIRRQFESFRKKEKKEKVSKGAEENSNMELEKSRKVKKKSITKPPEDAKQESPDACDYDSKRLASFSTIRSVFETQGQCTPPFNKLRTQSLVNKSLSNYQNDDHNRESDETSNSTECEDGVVNTPGSVLHAMKQKFEQLSEDAASPLLGNARKRCSPKQSSNSKEEVIKVNVDKSVYDDCLPLNKNEDQNVKCPTIETAIEDEDEDEKIGEDINEDEWCVLEDVIPTKLQAQCENEEEENIVVDVPSHLLPPEFVVGVPVSRSHLFREGSFRRVRTLASQYLKTSSNENISISSSDSNTDALENSKITTKVFQNASSTEYDSDVNEEEEMNVGVQEVDGDPTSNATQVNSQEELCMDTETVTEETLEDSKDSENINVNVLPELFAESSCETVDLQSSEYPNQNATDQYTSYSTMASNIYRDVSRLYGPSLPSSSTSEDNTVSPPVKPKPKPNTSKLQLGLSNVAMVSPFIKNESADLTDHPTAFANNEAFDTVKRRESVSGENVLARKPSVIWARVKKMEVSLVLDQDYKESDIIAIESFNVRRVNTYKDIEELAVDTFLKHVQLFDKHALELTKYDIGYLQVGDHRIRIGDQFDISQAKIQDGFLPCRICIKGKKEWSLASLSYDTLISKSYLEKYISLILCHRHVMFYGPSGTGKSYLARRIAMFLNHRINEGTIPPVILKNLTPDRWKLLLNNLLTERRERQFVVVLDGFSQSFIDSGIDIGDVITTCQDLEMQPYIICTLTQHPNVVTPLQWQQNFRWIWQPNHEEPANGLLQKYLRRKFIHHGNQHLQRESFRIADWLASAWRHINRIIEKYNSAEATIGATMFYTCPPDILTAEEWFVDLWNYSISPYFIQTVKQGLRLHGYRNDWEDPLEWILKTYPWVSEKAKRKMKLRRIRKEDVGYCVASSPDRRAVSISSSEQQRLLGFLRQLEMLMLDGGLDDIPFVEDKEPYESFI